MSQVLILSKIKELSCRSLMTIAKFVVDFLFPTNNFYQIFTSFSSSKNLEPNRFIDFQGVSFYAISDNRKQLIVEHSLKQIG